MASGFPVAGRGLPQRQGLKVHEFALAQELVRLAGQHAGTRRVTRLVVEIGALAAVQTEALRMGYDLSVAGTPLEGSELILREVPGLAHCRECQLEVELASPLAPCPRCGNYRLEWLGGQEVCLQSLEVEEDVP